MSKGQWVAAIIIIIFLVMVLRAFLELGERIKATHPRVGAVYMTECHDPAGRRLPPVYGDDC